MKNILLLLLLLNVIPVISQIQDISSLEPTEVWNLTIQNSKAQHVYLLGIIKNEKDNILVEFRSETIFLEQGVIVLSNDKVKTIKTDWKDASSQQTVVATGNFPKGTYSVCTKVMSKSTNKEIASPCRTIKFNALLIRKNDPSKYKNIHAYGSASLDYNYAEPLPYYSQLPSQYMRLEAEQGLSVYSFPISGMFRYSTEKTEIKQDVDMFSLRFDRSRFERNIKELILRKLAETQLKKVKMNESDLQKLTEYERLDEELSSSAIAKINEEMIQTKEQLTALGKQKIAPGLEEKVSSLQKTYKQLLEKKRRYDDIKNRYDQLNKLYQTWVVSGRLEELKSLVYDPPDFSDPKELLPYLKKYGAYTGMNKFLFNIKELSIGTSYPAYTPLTLNGTQVSGGNLEWNPGLFFVAVCGGKIHSSVSLLTDSLQAQFTQKVLGTRLGFGKIYGSYLSLNVIHYWDKDSSIITAPDQELYPEKSWVSSIDFNLNVGKNKWFQMSGELAGLYANQNNYDTARYPATSLSTTISEELNNIFSFQPNRSSSFDLAYHANIGFNLFRDNTHLEYERRFAGPGFMHPGVFGLPNDLQRNKYSIKQEMLDDRTSLSVYFTEEKDNFSESKSYRSDRNEIGLEWRWNSKNLPDINVRIAQSRIKNPFYYFHSTLSQIGLSKPWNIKGKWSAHSTIQAMYYITSTDSVQQQINTLYLFVQQSINLPKGFQIQVNGQWSNNSVAGLSNNISGCNINISKSLFKRIRIGTGIAYTKQDSINRFSISANLQGNLIRNMDFYIRYNNNRFSSYPNYIGTYQENWLQAGVKYSW
ncbi:MAG: hypothetical protein IPM92_08955 [Saprospiraceae bacterium]|nr:hypothetical protein [Saprospiraceae bacterium]